MEQALARDKVHDAHKYISAEEWPITLSVSIIITLSSTFLLLLCASPEFSWDEAYRLPYTADSWRSLWSGYDVSHGPMSVYLIKLGKEILLPASLEVRSRFLIAFVSSMGIGFLYWALRYCFKASVSAALVSCSLLMFSYIRLEETNIIGPHHLMLACTLVLAGLGYLWRDTPTHRAAIWLGVVTGLGALSMTYVIPAALCTGMAVSLAGKDWIAWDRIHFKIAWAFPIAFATSVIVVIALWPPGILRHIFLKDFLFYLHFESHPTLVGDQIFAQTPRWAVGYWLARLEVPLLIASISIIPIALWKAFRNDQWSSKHLYLLIFLTFSLGTALTAHIAGARNLLQFIAVLCLVIGALFDEALNHNQPVIRFASGLVGCATALNLVWLSLGSEYVPYVTTDGYKAFLAQNQSRLSENAQALVYGLPILQAYAEQSRIPIAWDVSEMPWTPRADASLPPQVKYVLIPEFVYKYMPPEQPMRRVVAEHWTVAWEFTGKHVWALRLYERP
jgi:hypothetical protein